MVAISVDNLDVAKEALRDQLAEWLVPQPALADSASR